jgi:hypothetical protein
MHAARFDRSAHMRVRVRSWRARARGRSENGAILRQGTMSSNPCRASESVTARTSVAVSASNTSTRRRTPDMHPIKSRRGARAHRPFLHRCLTCMLTSCARSNCSTLDLRALITPDDPQRTSRLLPTPSGCCWHSTSQGTLRCLCLHKLSECSSFTRDQIAADESSG